MAGSALMIKIAWQTDLSDTVAFIQQYGSSKVSELRAWSFVGYQVAQKLRQKLYGRIMEELRAENRDGEHERNGKCHRLHKPVVRM